MKNIFLIGFMGTGKSAISNALNKNYHMRVIDMDSEIERRQNSTISEIFAVKGEEYFRDLETQLIKDLGEMDNTVVSCGGGAVLRHENVLEMKKSGKVVLLKATPQTVLKRVKHCHNRPLLEGNKTVEGISRLMEAREDKYRAAADFAVTVDDRTVDDIAAEIHSLVCS